MAVTNQEITAFLAANPNMSDADLVSAMRQNNISPSQMAQATGLSEGAVVSRVAQALPPGANANLGGVWVSPVYEESGSGENYTQGPLREVLVYREDQSSRGDPYKQYSASGELIATNRFQGRESLGGLIKSIATDLSPVILAAAGGAGVGGLLGGAIAPGASAATQAGIGGALLGGGGAALTGQDVARGALLGGAGGYLSSALTAPAQDSIYSLANGPSNLNYMGGGQGLTSTGAANLASMGGAQGLQVLAGLPSATLAEALSSFGGVNPSVLADMGIGTGITYVTPSGIVTENGTIIGGDVISELGANTGFDLPRWLNENVGAGIGDQLAEIDTGIGTGLNAGAGTGSGTGAVTATGAGAATGITVPRLLDAARLAAVVAGVTGAANSGGTSDAGFDVVPVPSDWRSPTYSQAQYQPLTPIDFGTRELLRGTQWEKFLNPVQPLAVQNAQTGIGFNQLMNTLQGGQAGSLSLNDIISGIQGQYGQTPPSTVG